MAKELSDKLFRELKAFESYEIANAVESFKVRLRNEGFTGPGIVCRTKKLPPMAGIAVTLKVHSADPPMKPAFYLEQSDWWQQIEDSKLPRVLVIEDTGAQPGRGSLVGPVHASIIKAMGFVGVVTTGAIRGTRQYAELELHAFSRNVTPSHAYSHVVAIGAPVEIAGLRINPGDVVHGDRDGIVSIPIDLAERIPDAARQLVERERKIMELCAGPEFSREKLWHVICADSSAHGLSPSLPDA